MAEIIEAKIDFIASIVNTEHSCYCSGKVDITYKPTGRLLKSGNILLTH